MSIVLAWPAGAAEPSAAPSPAGGSILPQAPVKNTVRWTTDGLNHFGYDVYRAESESGPFVKINAQMVSGASGQRVRPESQSFEYVDDTIDPHKDYWYYVEATTLMKEKLKFTPTLKAPAKRPLASPAPPAK